MLDGMKTSYAVNTIDTARLYRMPWSMSDNAFCWLEPTRACDLRCEYCYQHNDPSSHKNLTQIEHELDAMLGLRRTDAVIIAGGEPLLHPEITAITASVRSRNAKPVILTNGTRLTPKLVHGLKRAGAFGLMLHIDSHQSRPGWESRSERQLNTLRQTYADMIHDEGGLICGYNTTILPETLHEVTDIVKWTMSNIHRVAAQVLIPVRTAHADDPWSYYAGRKAVDLSETPYGAKRRYAPLSATDICGEIWKAHPDYVFHSYLGGTVVADAPKWLFGTHVGTTNVIYGNLGPRVAELFQSVHHFLTGRFLSFLPPQIQRFNRWLFPLMAIDRTLRSAVWRYLSAALRGPWSLFARLSHQHIIVMQPHDVLPNGEQDECDGCPNKTYWNGRLVSECRQEDYIRFGRPIMTIAKMEKRTRIPRRA
jgi:hypothetical protein